MNSVIFLDEIAMRLGSYIPTLIGALALLLIGWMVALFVAALVRGVLSRTTLDERIATWLLGKEQGKVIELEKGIAKAVFYVILLFVLVAFFEELGLVNVAETLQDLLTPIVSYLPRFVEAGFVLLLAWIVASGLRLMTTRVLGIAKMDKRLEIQAGLRSERGIPLSKMLGDMIYWLVFVLFLPALLDALELGGLLGPVQGMADEILGFLPNLLAAGIFFFVGLFVARIVQRITTNLLLAIGADHFSERVGIEGLLGSRRLSEVLGSVVHILILIPVAIASLDALQLDVITEPASDMLRILFAAIPSLFGAALVMVFAYLIGKAISQLVANVLSKVGFNALVGKLGLMKVTNKKWMPSMVAGYLVLVAILLFALMEAFRLLGFALLADLTADFVVFASHVLFGLVILAIGLYLAAVASHAVRSTRSPQADFLTFVARISILVFAGAVALRQMGLANEIISLAFAFIVGSIAVAIALAFGLGGRDVAGRYLEEWSRSLGKKRKSNHL
ncbi:MAG: mechanosensitive ion channel [Patescibacteria group bacterium]